MLDVIEKESGVRLDTLKVDGEYMRKSKSGINLTFLLGGVTNSDLAMQLQANVSLLSTAFKWINADTSQIGGFKVARPAMRESTALGSALLAGHALKLFGWDLTDSEGTLSKVNTADATIFEPEYEEKHRLKKIRGWERAVERAKQWHTAEEEDEAEEEFEKEERAAKVD